MDSLVAQKLQQAELDVARMATQAAQEAAMAEVLPRRFLPMSLRFPNICLRLLLSS